MDAILPVPSIIDWFRFKKWNPNNFRFQMPAVNNGVTILHPQSEILRVAHLEMGAQCATPVQIRNNTEKLYVYYRGIVTEFHVLMLEKDQLVDKAVSDQSSVLVPRGIPHAVYCTGHRKVEVMVISSAKDSSDLIWEPNADKLIK